VILLDTNVLSEVMRTGPDPNVEAWIEAQAADTLYVSSISCAELWLGAAILPQGRRKQSLTMMIDQVLALFQPRILPFDQAAARAYAGLIAQARLAGRAINTPDAQIAAIAKAHGFAIATRDAMPFEAAGLTVINPWKIIAA
jgi:predicted nucleic acid-binding protein